MCYRAECHSLLLEELALLSSSILLTPVLPPRLRQSDDQVAHAVASLDTFSQCQEAFERGDWHYDDAVRDLGRRTLY
jgi:hypothetical protein